MNIFVLDYLPAEAAKMHCDKHVVKMILESVQMLSTLHYEQSLPAPYKPTHANHPCTLWVKQSLQNYDWLCQLVEALHDEWQYRYNHEHNHKSYDAYLQLKHEQIDLPCIGLTPPAQAMPGKYRQVDTVEAYRAYYINDKAPILTYTNRLPPEWIQRLTNDTKRI